MPSSTRSTVTPSHSATPWPPQATTTYSTRPGRSGRPVRRPARPQARRWWRDAAGSLTWLSLLAVVALWVHGGGLGDLGSWASGLTTLGRLTGLLSADLLLLQVLMMARVPFVERAYGQDELTRRHRWVGFASFTLMLAHIALLAVGYAAGEGTSAVAELWTMLATFPGMLMAGAGTALLVVVTVTSIRLARRKLRYESWHLLHLYAYLGVFLALPHQLWTGADFMASRAATAYWWTLWALTALAVVQYRVGVPLYRTLRHRLVVDRVVKEAPGVVSVYMTGRHLHELSSRAGQFFIWRFLDGPGWTRGNPYSLSAAPDGRTLRVTVKDLGDSSHRLARLRRGTKVLIEGPYGRLTGDVRTRRNVTLVASGIGITPMRALLEEFDDTPGAVTLIYRTSSQNDIVFRRELDELSAARGASLWYVPGHRSARHDSWLPAGQESQDPAHALAQLAPAVADSDVYVCGPESWMDAVRDAARRAGTPADRIHLERFAI
jgi:predicted ferric reductase